LMLPYSTDAAVPHSSRLYRDEWAGRFPISPMQPCPIHRGCIAMSGRDGAKMVYALRIETVSEGGRQVAQASLCHYRPKATKTGLCPIHRGCIAMSGARSRVPLCAFAKGGKPQKPPNFVPRQVAQASLCHYRPKATKTGLCPIHRGCIAMSGARSRQPCRPLRFDLHNTLDSCRQVAQASLLRSST